jgi:TetR/AcrR family transcriptional regulator
VTGERLATRRRGRPRSSERGSGLEPREEILRHASRLFSAKGLGATRLADIADAVGVRAPAIYYHFANLDAIVAHLLDYVVEESAAFATRSAASGGTSSERLWALVEHHVRRLTDGPYDLWFVAGLSDDDRARFPGVTGTADRWRDAVIRLFEEGRKSGEFRSVDSRLALSAVSGLVYGALELRHHAGHVDAADIADLVVAALAAPAPRRG